MLSTKRFSKTIVTIYKEDILFIKHRNKYIEIVELGPRFHETVGIVTRKGKFRLVREQA